MLKNPDDHIYYNALFNNNTDVLQPARFTETRTVPFLLKPYMYHMALIRFTIPTFSIPLLIWPTIGNDRKTPNNSYYSFTMKYGLIEHREYLIYNPWTNSQNPSIYMVQNLIDIMNNALNNLFIYMQINAPGFPATTPPYIVYDQINYRLNLIAEQAYNCNSNITPGIKLYANYYCHNLFETVPHIKLSNNANTINGKDILYVIEKTGNNDINTNCPIGVYSSIPGYEMRSEFQSLQNIWALKSIVITSFDLRIKEEYIQTPESINADSSSLIITDFEPLKNDPTSRSWMQYQAQIYRYVDMKSTDIMRSIDLNIYWTDKQGYIYDLMINPGDYFSIKLLFTLKDSIH